MSAVAVSHSEDLLACLDPWVRVAPARPVLVAVEPLVPFFCELCGHEFGVKERQARAIRAGTRKQLCTFCRDPREGATRQFRVTQADRLFWLERFTVEEIRQIAELCWGPIAGWTDEWRKDYVFERTP